MSARVGLNAQLLHPQPGYRAAGISIYTLRLLEHLPACAPDLELVAFLPRSAASSLARLQLERVTSRLPTERPEVRILWEQLLLPRLLGTVDLFHGLAFALPRACPAPAVVTFHDLSFLLHPAAFRRLRRWYLALASRQAARQARLVIAVSESTARDAQRLLGVDADRVVAIPNGVEPAFRPRPRAQVEAFRRSQGLPEAFFLSVSTLEPRKNLVGLLRAYALLRRESPQAGPLYVVGARGWGREPLLRRRRALGLEGQVFFPGYVPPAELPLWYNAATVFVYPSIYEGFGLPVLEAMASGTPVVTSSTSSLPELADGAALLVDPLRPEAIAQAMGALWRSSELCAELSGKGLERARGYSWERTARETADAYRRALG